MKKITQYLLFTCLVALSWTSVQAQDFTFTEIENPPGFTFSGYQTDLDDIAFLSYYDLSFYQTLFTFDGETLTEVPNPIDFSYGYFLTEYNGIMYFVYYDFYFNSYLFEFDGTTLTQVVVSSPDEYVIDYAFELNGDLYFIYIDFLTFNYHLRVLDNGVILDVELPSGFTYGDELGQIGPFQYVSLNDPVFNTVMYSFDGNTFEEVVNTPSGANFFFPLTSIDETLYIGFYDAFFFLSVYTFDGGVFTELPTPADYFLQGYIGELDGVPYFSFFDNVTYQSAMFQLDGMSWNIVPNPVGYQFNYLPSFTESTFYAAYFPTFGFETVLGIYEGMDVEIVPGLPGFQYNRYLADYDGGILLYYFDPNFFGDLQYYNGIEHIQVPPPEVGYQFQNFGFELNDELFFTYYDFNFNSRLYRLGEPNVAPSAEDNTVTTLIETPYNFEIEDFNFLDLNLDDTLQSIMIVSLPDSGYLHLNGGNVPPGFIFSGPELELLTYIPSNDGEGTPYTSFKFKVSDGELFSEEEYTMYVNVVKSLSQKDLFFAESIEVFPNPSYGDFNISFDSDKPVLSSMRLFNSQGMLIDSRVLTDDQNYLSYQGLAKGVYYVYIENEFGRAAKKLMIQ